MTRNRKPPVAPAPKTARYIKQLASEGLARPSKLKAAQVQELAASVMAHIEPRVNNAKACEPMRQSRNRAADRYSKKR